MRWLTIFGAVLALSACGEAVNPIAPAVAAVTPAASTDCDSADYRREVVNELGVLMEQADLEVLVANRENGWAAYQRQMISTHDEVIAKATALAERTIACGV